MTFNPYYYSLENELFVQKKIAFVTYANILCLIYEKA